MYQLYVWMYIFTLFGEIVKLENLYKNKCVTRRM